MPRPLAGCSETLKRFNEALQRFTEALSNLTRPVHNLYRAYAQRRAVKICRLTKSQPVSDRVVFGPACSVVAGLSGEEEKWSLCVADTETVLPFSVGAMFVRRHFDITSKHAARIHVDRKKLSSE